MDEQWCVKRSCDPQFQTHSTKPSTTTSFAEWEIMRKMLLKARTFPSQSKLPPRSSSKGPRTKVHAMAKLSKAAKAKPQPQTKPKLMQGRQGSASNGQNLISMLLQWLLRSSSNSQQSPICKVIANATEKWAAPPPLYSPGAWRQAKEQQVAAHWCNVCVWHQYICYGHVFLCACVCVCVCVL